MPRYIDADIALDKMKKWHTQERLMDCVRDTPTADVVEVKDCEQCIHSGKHVTEYPCSHCRNCYTDKFKIDETRTPKERGGEK